MTDSSPPIVVEQAFNVSKETVWKAITEHDQMIQWFFDNIPEFSRESCEGGWTYLIQGNLKNYLEPANK